MTHIVWIMQYELPNRENIRGWTVQPRSKTVWLGNAISVSRKTYRKNIRFHPYPNCTSTQVCKMGRKSNCVSCELLANSFSNVSTALYGQHFFRFFQKFFKTGWILVTKIVFSPISQFFAISPFGPSRKSNCVMLRFALRKMNYVSSEIAFFSQSQ